MRKNSTGWAEVKALLVVSICIHLCIFDDKKRGPLTITTANAFPEEMIRNFGHKDCPGRNDLSYDRLSQCRRWRRFYPCFMAAAKNPASVTLEESTEAEQECGPAEKKMKDTITRRKTVKNDTVGVMEGRVLHDITKKKATNPSIKKNSKEKAEAVTGAKTRKSRKKSSSQSEPPLHWLNPRDIFDLSLVHPTSHQDDENNVDDAAALRASRIRFTVRGNPRPLQRHRTSRGFVYNPSADAQRSFRSKVTDLIYGINCSAPQSPKYPLPLFGESTLSMTIIFRLKRPKSHYVANRPGPGRLRSNAPPTVGHAGGDVDNLAKFVLDSLNGLLYEDDRQIASLHVTKLLDDEGEKEINEDKHEEEVNQGSTQVCVRVLRQDDVESLLQTALELH